MLAKKNRYQFRGKLPQHVLSTPLFVIRYDYNPNGLRGSIVVGKRVSESAVVRNRMRRQIAEILQRFDKEKSIFFNLVIYTRKGIEDLNLPELESAFAQALKKLT